MGLPLGSKPLLAAAERSEAEKGVGMKEEVATVDAISND